MAAPLRYVASMSTMLSLATLLGIAFLPVAPSGSADQGVREIPIQIVRSRPLLMGAASKTSSSRHTSTPHSSLEEGKQPALVQPAPSQSTNDASKPPAEPPSSANSAANPAAVEPVKDVWADSEVISALQECVRQLAPVIADVEILKPIKTDQCGTPAPIRLHSLGTSTKVEIVPPATINCHMASALHEWIEKSLQPAASEMLGSPVTQILAASSYSCRNRNNGLVGPISEHAFANAIDISGFVTLDGRTIDVLKDWGPTARDNQSTGGKPPAPAAGDKRLTSVQPRAGKSIEQSRSIASYRGTELSRLGAKIPPVPTDSEAKAAPTESVFLRRLHRSACGIFQTVLGPEANEAHRNHFHFDLKVRSRKAFCE
jgi:hypothetical protein